MKKAAIVLLIGLLIHLASYGQNDTVIKPGLVNLATLIVDYDTYAFEGGNMSYYTCPGCSSDSLPFIADYHEPGDFGSITFKLDPSLDTVFNAGIIWMGVGQILYPETFHMGCPFTFSGTSIEKPLDIKYMNMAGSELNNPVLLNKADSAWNVIDSLEVAGLFAKHAFKAGIYMYPPRVGMFDPGVAKWIIFLYYNDKTNSIGWQPGNQEYVNIYPNPASDRLNIESGLTIKAIKILNLSGRTFIETHDKMSISVSGLPSGIYNVVLITEDGLKNQRFVKL